VRILASDAARAVGGRLVGPDVAFVGASFDSRTLEPGQLFVPIVAERDGHEFVDAARAAGAAVHLTAHQGDGVDGVPAGGTAIEVGDTAGALIELARWARGRLAATVVGITGSVGKTSTKDLCATACAAGRRTAASTRSFNNEQGLPVTILDAPDDVEVLIVEMGMRGFGEISRLCEIARPDVGVVTAVGHAHTERVGGIEGVARAKGELVEALPASGTAILNADDERVLAMRVRTGASVLTFGSDGRADVAISALTLDERARPSFTVRTPWGVGEVRLAVSGAHMASNAAAAIAVAGVVGVDLAVALDALGRAGPSAMRMEVLDGPGGSSVINDTYNANPTSMRAALDALAASSATRRVAVLGLMAELDDPAGAHVAVADYARQRDIEVVTVGTDAYGIEPTDDPVAALGALGPGDVVLVKASRAAGLERVVDELVTPDAKR
jgi:UDP-N-acetylmuramoyl-tripeptide--D-alanyl-D-alanine ligase